jgi:hypothetical protein
MRWSNEQCAFAVEAYFSNGLFFKKEASLPHPVQGKYKHSAGRGEKKTLSPRANYTDRATAACRRSVANLCG